MPPALSVAEWLSWVYLGSCCFPPISAPDPQTRPTYLSASSSVFSLLRSITSPTVLANLCGEWGTPAGRRKICRGGDKVPAPHGGLSAAASQASPADHSPAQPPLFQASTRELEEMSGCAEMDSLEEEVPEDGAEAGWAGRRAGRGWEHKTTTKARRVDMLGSCSGAQPYLSLPNDHIPVSPLLQDLEKHVAF